ncbi:hypothetical protein QFZ82_002280 [Streptomyces sp. V4I23]|uniref:hypothetical protein n=1 Tax=Streptomyces sp. V4I23 TaxID=3042282 RepID=UPI00277F19C7|nr:hypothetical protein [Streptomyces sp. V4I23]MDQ1007795.1 hypothetical protein [Streptomyces sp. V4I23]
MRTSFKIHAGAQLSLSVAGLLAASLAALPFPPPFANEWLLLGIGIALLVPLHVATIVRSIAVGLRDMRFASSKANQWRALRSLPRRVQGLLAGVGLAGVMLLVGAGADDSSLQGADSVRGRYFAIDTSDPQRGRIEITRSEYEALRKEDQQVVFAAFALFAAGGGGLTLVFAKLGTQAGRW